MTSALIALGVCHVVTASGLRPAASPGRVALGCGGVTAILPALFPAPGSGGSLDHGAVVTAGALPLSGSVPWGLRPGPSTMATTLMWLGGVWFLLALLVHDTAGAAERVLTFARSLWPLVVVLSCLRRSDSDEETV